MNVAEDTAQMGGEMIQNGMKDEVEMRRGIMIDDGVMIDTESAETVQR